MPPTRSGVAAAQPGCAAPQGREEPSDGRRYRRPRYPPPDRSATHRGSPKLRAGRAEVDVTIDRTVGECTQVERARTQRSELGPTDVGRRNGRHRDDRIRQLRATRWAKASFATPRASSTSSRESHTAGLIDHDRRCRTIKVDEAQRCRVPRDAATGVGGTVDRVDDDDLAGYARIEAAFLRQDADPGAAQTRPTQPRRSSRRGRTARHARPKVPSR